MTRRVKRIGNTTPFFHEKISTISPLLVTSPQFSSSSPHFSPLPLLNSPSLTAPLRLLVGASGRGLFPRPSVSEGVHRPDNDFLLCMASRSRRSRGRGATHCCRRPHGKKILTVTGVAGGRRVDCFLGLTWALCAFSGSCFPCSLQMCSCSTLSAALRRLTRGHPCL